MTGQCRRPNSFPQRLSDRVGLPRFSLAGSLDQEVAMKSTRRAKRCHPNLPQRCVGKVTKHARGRIYGRGLSEDKIELVRQYGRRVFTLGAVIYAVGRREVEGLRRQGVDLQVV